MSRVLGISNWLPTAAGALFTNTGRLKSVDWQRLTKGPAAYVFEDMLPEKPQHALNAMLAALARCQDMVYDLADDKSNLPELQRRQRRETTEMIEHVCAFEAAAPKTVMHVQIHQLVHVAKCSYRWNRVRNFWAFANERSYYSFQLHLLTRNNPANCNRAYFQTRLL
jgi:hypothetical protein